MENEGLVCQYVFSLMRRYPQFRDQEEDVLQELRYVLIFGMTDYDATKGAFSTWLHWKMRKAFEQWQQHQATLVRCPRLKRGIATLPIGPLSADVPYEPQMDTLSEEIQAALATLPERERYVAIRLGLEDATYREVAAELRLSRSTVDTLWVRAKHALREVLADVR